MNEYTPTDSVRAIGVDPGPIPGLVCLDYVDKTLRRAVVRQCSDPMAVAGYLGRLTANLPYRSTRVVVGVEQYVVGHRSARSTTPSASYTTRLVADACALAAGPLLSLRSASLVKAWATDDRLRAAALDAPDEATLYALTRGKRHARDAARHALYAAVRDAGMADPLARRGTPKGPRP